MKLVGALVLLLVFISANGKSFLDGGPEDSTASWRFIPDDGPEDPDDYPVDLDKVHQTLNKMENGHSESKLRGKGSKCKPNIACTILNGYCVVNTTLCSGRLVADGCKGNNCQCCIPAGDNVNISINLKGDMEWAIQNLTLQIQSLKDSQDTAVNNLTEKLNNIMRHQGCPEGFFKHTGSTQCFKIFFDSQRNWTDARSKCQSEGLVLTKPYDAVALRSYIMQRYGLNDNIWVDAKGEGSYRFRWQRDRKVLTSSSLLIASSYTSSTYYSTSYCLSLDTHINQWKRYPNQPYMPNSCTITEYPLCEKIMQ